MSEDREVIYNDSNMICSCPQPDEYDLMLITTGRGKIPVDYWCPVHGMVALWLKTEKEILGL